MSVSNTTADGLADELRALYEDGERILLQRIAKALMADLDAPDWAERKLGELQLLLMRSRGELDALSPKSLKAIVYAILKAWNRGTATAMGDVETITSRVAMGANPANLPAVQQLINETTKAVVSSHAAILRTVEDQYRQIVRTTSAQVLLGTQTRREATQMALDRFADRGISGFVDKAGRHWGMPEYAEMATRTATQRATIDAHVQRLTEAGHDLVIVSDSPRECERCRPWEGRILSLSGLTHIGVEVAGTLDQARAAGLTHSNCTHRLGAYFPGVSTVRQPKADPAGYEAKQRQRVIERHIRDWKRREAVAVTPEAKATAKAKLKHWRAEAAANAAATGTKRLRYRET